MPCSRKSQIHVILLYLHWWYVYVYENFQCVTPLTHASSVYVYMCICVYVYMCICVYVYMCICVYVFMCICVYVCMCICVYVYMCVCVYVYMCKCYVFMFPFPILVSFYYNIGLYMRAMLVTAKYQPYSALLYYICYHWTYRPGKRSDEYCPCSMMNMSALCFLYLHSWFIKAWSDSRLS